MPPQETDTAPQAQVPIGIDAARCVLVTGATSGIGRALALAIAALPSEPTVIAAGRRPARLAELAQVKGVEPLALALGRDLGPLKEAADALIARFPDLDTLILNAGVQYPNDFTSESAEDILPKVLDEFAVNYTSVVALITYLLPHLLKIAATGRACAIVVVTSAVAIAPAPLVPSYCASKAALRSFASSLRVQLQGTGVRVMDIIPPLVESEIHDAQGTTQELSKIWMPLSEFIPSVMEGLRAGNDYIPVGFGAQLFERFEKGKDEISKQLARKP